MIDRFKRCCLSWSRLLCFDVTFKFLKIVHLFSLMGPVIGSVFFNVTE